MNYARIKLCDIANGPGVRTSLFVSGCRHHCPGCFNADAWSFSAGAPFDDAVQDHVIDTLRPAYVAGLSLLGGEPMEPENAEALLPFIRHVRKELPEKTIWCWSGFTWEQLTGAEPCRCQTEAVRELLSLLDVLVDGPFVESEKDVALRFRGSHGQRILDVRRSLSEGRPVLWIDEPVYGAHQMPARKE